MSNANDFVIKNGILKEYTGFDSHVIIPDGVTSIGDWAFANCDSIKSITIPDGVISIGCDAFYECDSLKSITIPNSVQPLVIGRSPIATC